MDIIIPTNKTNLIIYPSRFTSFMKCGRYTHFKNELELIPIGGKSNNLEIGSIIHKFMEVYYRSQSKGLSKTQSFGFGIAAAELYIQGCPHCSNFQSIAPLNIPCSCLPLEDIHRNVDDSTLHTKDCAYIHGVTKPPCNHEPNEYPGLSNTPMESEGYHTGWKFALQTCDEYSKFYINDHWMTIDVETERKSLVYEDEDIRIMLKARFDWIVDTNQGIYPVDHKTMKQNKDTLSINNQFMIQCILMGTKNVFINKVGLQKTLKPEDKFKRVSVSYTAARLLEFQNYILPYYCKQMLAWKEQGHFPPNYNSCETKYGKCEFYGVCESDPDMREEELRNGFMVDSDRLVQVVEE